MTVAVQDQRQRSDAAHRPLRGRRHTPRFLQTWPTRIACAVLLVILTVAIAGRYVAPYPPEELVAPSGLPPSPQFRLGTDYVGEDVLSRVLAGGSHLVILATLATLVPYLLGGLAGLIAGYSRSVVDPVIMRSADLLLAFPSLFLILLLATRFGTSTTVVVLGVTLAHLPYVVRLVRTATLEMSVRGYVEAAVARGESTLAILHREILPNIWGPISADVGPRLTISILLVSGLNYLGVGVAPPAPDWAVMISENRSLFELNRWAITAPAVMIALLTISVSIVADAIARTRANPVEPETGQ